MGSNVQTYEGYRNRGGETPRFNPHGLAVVGVDVPATAENWYAQCPRADEPLDDEWLEDLRTNGVQRAVDAYLDGKTLVLLEGRRRVRGARIIYDEQAAAGVPEAERIGVVVAIHKGTPDALHAFNVGGDNFKAKSPMQRAAQFLLYYNHTGEDRARTAARFGCTGQTVANMLALFDLSKSLQGKVDKGEVSIREALKLGDVPREQQDQAVEAAEAAGATRGKKAAAIIPKMKEQIKAQLAEGKRGKDVKVTVDKADVEAATKTRPRAFLERWQLTLAKASRSDETGDMRKLVGWLEFILGGKPPRGMGEAMEKVLVEAGYRGEKRKTVVAVAEAEGAAKGKGGKKVRGKAA